jgi:hypothetical protein
MADQVTYNRVQMSIEEFLQTITTEYNEYLNYDRELLLDLRYINQNELMSVVRYIMQKLGVQRAVPFGTNPTIYPTFISTKIIFEYIYFNESPTLYSLLHDNAQQSVTINNNTYNHKYFIWIKEGDQNHTRSNEEITPQNFNNYKRSLFGNGWTRPQLEQFFKSAILPQILSVNNININRDHPVYQRCIRHYFRDYWPLLGTFIKKFISLQSPFTSNDQIDSSIRGHINHFIRCIQSEQRQIERNIERRITESREKSQEKIKKARKNLQKSVLKPEQVRRFKWENICATLGDLKLDDLRELAAKERIPFWSMLSKREICAELSKKVHEQINLKVKLQSKCSNDSSIFTMESIKDIPAEFFFSYRHNGQTYCDDIRSLYTHFTTNGNKHPIDRTPVSRELVNIVINEYKHLVSVTNNMKDDPNTKEEVVSKESMLTSNTASFVSLLNYPNDSTLFINSNQQTFNRFLNELRAEGILSQNELSMLPNNLIDKKLQFIDLISLKIRNDSQQVETSSGTLSAIAINTSNVYNNIFNHNSTESTIQLTESPTEISELTESEEAHNEVGNATRLPADLERQIRDAIDRSSSSYNTEVILNMILNHYNALQVARLTRPNSNLDSNTNDVLVNELANIVNNYGRGGERIPIAHTTEPTE